MAVRLRRLKKRYGKKLELTWRSFPLHPDESPGRRFNAHSVESWAKAGESERSIRLKRWDEQTDLPSSSMPALEAAKCAVLQGSEAFERFHYRVFKAYFEETKDISQLPVLLKLARAARLDVKRFTSDLESGTQRATVLAEYQEGRQKAGITSIPTVIFDDGNGAVRIIGDVPESQFRRLIEWFLAT